MTAARVTRMRFLRGAMMILFAMFIFLTTSRANAAIANYDTQWEYQLAPRTTDPQQVLSSALQGGPSWKPMTTKGNPADWNKQDEMWVRVKLPDGEFWNSPDSSLLLAIVDQAFEVYAPNRQLIYSFGTIPSEGKIGFSGYKPHLIPLWNLHAGETIAIRIVSQHDNIGLSGTIGFGSRFQFLLNLLIDSLPNLLVGGVVFLLGIFIFVLLLLTRGDRVQFAYGGVMLTIGFYTLKSKELISFIVPSLNLLTWLEWISLYSAGYFVPFYTDALFHAFDRFRILRTIWLVNLTFALVAFLGSAFGFFSLFQTVFPWQLLIMFTLIGMMIIPVYAAFKKSVEAWLWLGGMGTLMLASFTAILCAMQILPRSLGGTMMMLGVLVMSGLFGGIIIFRFREVKRKIQEYAEELQEKNEQLHIMDKLKDQFLANTSHELRTPLVGILGIAESLLEGAAGSLNDAMKRNLTLIVQSGRRLANLINDILDFSRLKEKEIEVDLQPVDLDECVSTVLTMSTPLIGKKNLSLQNALPKDLPSLRADANRLQQILFNLIGNAIKFTESGTVTVTARIIDTMVEVSVTDTGIGIPAESMNRIFEAFEQGDASTTRKHGGTGLGLSITKQLLELQHGTIRVESELGKGTTFTFALPWTSDKPHFSGDPAVDSQSVVMQHPAQEIEKEVPPQLAHGTNARILVVDDEAVNRQVLRNHLSLHKFQYVDAASGEECLQILENDSNFDAILLDVMMPSMSGYTVCQKIRQRWSLEEMPVIFLTAKNQLANLVEGFSAGGNDYLTKPFFSNELLARLNLQTKLSTISRDAKRRNGALQAVLERMDEMSTAGERIHIVQVAAKALLNVIYPEEKEFRVTIETLEKDLTGSESTSRYTAVLSSVRLDETRWMKLSASGEERQAPLPLPVNPSGVDVDKQCLTFSATHQGTTLARIVLSHSGLRPLTSSEEMHAQLIVRSLRTVMVGFQNAELLTSERFRRKAEEQRALIRLVALAAQVSDRLNSPILVAQNVQQSLAEKADWAQEQLATGRSEDVAGMITKKWKPSLAALSSALTELQLLSQDLAELREVSSKIEATAALTGKLQH